MNTIIFMNEILFAPLVDERTCACTDLKEPRWPNESQGVKRHTDNTYICLEEQ